MKKLLLAVALVMGTAAYAQIDMSKLETGLGLGAALPLSDFKDSNKASFATSVYGDYKFHEYVTAGMEIARAWNHSYKDLDEGKITTWQFTPYVKSGKDFDVMGKKVNAYGQLGLGIYNVKASGLTGFADDSQTKFGWNLGIGASMEVAPQWLVGLKVAYHSISTNDTTTKYITPSLMVSYLFK